VVQSCLHEADGREPVACAYPELLLPSPARALSHINRFHLPRCVSVNISNIILPPLVRSSDWSVRMWTSDQTVVCSCQHPSNPRFVRRNIIWWRWLQTVNRPILQYAPAFSFVHTFPVTRRNSAQWRHVTTWTNLFRHPSHILMGSGEIRCRPSVPNAVERLWVSWKSAQWKAHCTLRHKCISAQYYTFFARFGNDSRQGRLSIWFRVSWKSVAVKAIPYLGSAVTVCLHFPNLSSDLGDGQR